MTGPEALLLFFGLAGQALYSARFLVQWWASERAGHSVLPNSFWYFSIGGGLALLAYAALRADLVFVIGQVAGLVVYLRNLRLIHRAGPGRA